MKPTIKFSLLGVVAGAVLMFVAVLFIELQLDKHPTLDQQVIQHLENEGYSIDSLGDNMYAFYVDGDKFIFDYFPNDPTYLRIFAGYGLEEYSRDDLADACFRVMSTKKNCTMILEETDYGPAVRICCESFVSRTDAVDTDIIDRSIRIIKEARILLFHHLTVSDAR